MSSVGPLFVLQSLSLLLSMISHFNSNLGATLFYFHSAQCKITIQGNSDNIRNSRNNKNANYPFPYMDVHVTKCHCLFLPLNSWMFLVIIIINLSAGFCLFLLACPLTFLPIFHLQLNFQAWNRYSSQHGNGVLCQGDW